MLPAGVVAIGELMLRLSAPNRELLMQSPRLDACFGGAEANVAVALSRLGTPTRFVTSLPFGPLGDAAISSLRGDGVDVAHVARGEGRLGLYFVAPGAGIRASEVVYDRAGSAFALRGAGAVDWRPALAGASRLHVSGVTLAVSAAAEQAALDGIAAAGDSGVGVSFDCNFRARLWEARGSDPRAAILRAIAGADLIFADHRDLRLLTGEDVAVANDHAATRCATAGRFFAMFPDLRFVASVDRHVESHDCHILAAGIVARDGRVATARPYRLTAIVDRIGGGDAFAAGLLHMLGTDADLQSAVDFGAAAGALKHTLPGDAFRLDAAAVRGAMDGGADVRR